jgi:hypothetical protein
MGVDDAPMGGAKSGFIRELKLLLGGRWKKSPAHSTKNQCFEKESGFTINEISCNPNPRV